MCTEFKLELFFGALGRGILVVVITNYRFIYMQSPIPSNPRMFSAPRR